MTNPALNSTDPTPNSLTAPAFLRWLKLHRRLRPLLLEAMAETVAVEAARAANLTVTAEEL